MEKLAEQASASASAGSGSLLDRLLDALTIKSLVNHGAHLRGFAFGAAFAVLGLGLPSLLRWRRRARLQ